MRKPAAIKKFRRKIKFKKKEAHDLVPWCGFVTEPSKFGIVTDGGSKSELWLYGAANVDTAANTASIAFRESCQAISLNVTVRYASQQSAEQK
jgi:hypothetical protein